MRSDLELKTMIQKVHEDFPGYGYRRLKLHLKNEGITANSKRIRRVMKIYQIFSSRRKRVGPKGIKAYNQLYYPNLVRGLKLTGPNQMWSVDITFIRLLRGYVYLNAVIDVYTRQIVGWAISKNLGHEFCIKALEIAIKKRKPAPGIIHHSDRGTQYTCDMYVDFLKHHGFKISMSNVGTPEDNAFIEAFFKTLKHEEVYARNYQSISEVIRHLPKFIDEVYNAKRLHSSLGYKAPDEFERQITKLKPADRPVHKLWGYAV